MLFSFQSTPVVSSVRGAPRRIFMFRPTCLMALVVLLTLPVLSVEGAPWPAQRDGLHLAFQDALHPAVAYRADGTPIPGWRFDAMGLGRVRHDGALLSGNGGFEAPSIGPAMGDVFAHSTTFTLSFAFTSTSAENSGNILGLGDLRGPKGCWLQVAQESDTLHVSLHTSSGEVRLAGGKVVPEESTTVAFTCDEDVFAFYQDGREVARHAVTGAPQITHPTTPVIGQAKADVTGWQGAVEGIALYNERLSLEAVAGLHSSFAAVQKARLPVATLALRGTLREKSSILAPSELAPYERGLTVFIYDVEEVLDGVYGKKTIYVAHWTVLDRTALPFAAVPVGSTETLYLELFDDNPQLESENLSDDAVMDFTIPYYYDAGGCSLRALLPEKKP